MVGINGDKIESASRSSEELHLFKLRQVRSTVSQNSGTKIRKINGLIESLCGIYSRVARRLGVHRTYVSRVARGERRSEKIENALIAEYDRVQEGKQLPR
jgi:hypothetical protein